MVSTPVRDQTRSDGQSRSDRFATGLDVVVLITAAWMAAVSLGIDPLPGRRWAALAFFLLGPGWAAQRRVRVTATAESVFVAIGTSIATVLVAGHLTVTVFDWQWEPVLFVLAAATGVSMAEQWWRWGPTGLRLAPSVGDDSTDAGSSTGAAGAEHHWLTEQQWWGVVAAGTFGAAVAVIGLMGADPRAVDDLGLLSAIPVVTAVGVAVTVVSMVSVLGERPRDQLASAWLLALVIVVLHGAPGIVEAHPRFPVAWLHVGFIDHISTEGTLLTDLDARFSWPGFFAGGALLDRAAGTDGLLWMVRFAPVGFALLACLGVWVLGRILGMDATTAAGAGLVFAVVNWSAQDYFSPQATGFLLMLVVVVLVSRWFPGRGPEPTGTLARLLRWRSSAEAPSIDRERSTEGDREVWRLVAVLAVCGAIIISHQLTPGFLAAMLLALGLSGVIRLRWIGAMVVLMTAAWLSFAGEAWWLGHLDTLTGSVGDVGGIVNDNVGERASGAGESREVVLRARVGLSLVLWGGVGVVLARAWWRGPTRRELFLAAMFASPFPLLAAQPYGGELIIRIFLFVLPAAALLVAGVVLAEKADPWRRAILAIALVSSLPLFVLGRFGNEEFEMVLDGDLETAAVLLEEAPSNTAVFIANGQALVHVDRVGAFRFVSLGDISAAAMLERIDETEGVDGRFVYLTRQQEAFGELAESKATGWLQDTADDLVETGAFVVHQNDERGAVLEYAP